MLAKLLLFVCALLGSARTYAQTAAPNNKWQHIRFKHLTTENGLTQSVNTCLFEDHNGWLWIGSFDGLCRFDGINTRVYRHLRGNNNSLQGGKINDIIEDKRGNLWVGCNGALNYYDRQHDRFRAYYLQDAQGKSLKTKYIPWAIQPNGDLIFTDNVAVYQLQLTANGIANITRIAACTPFAKINYKLPPALAKALSKDLPMGEGFMPTDALWDAADTCVWLATAHGLVRYSPKTQYFEGFMQYEATTIAQVNKICIANQKVWVGTEKDGLFVFDKRQKRFVAQYTHNDRDPTSLAGNRITQLCTDAAGNVFAVAWGAGIDYCNTQKLKFAHYFTQQIAQNAQLSNNFVRCICPADNGTTWCGTQNDGIVVFSPEHVLLQHVALTASGLPTTSIDFLLFDRQTLYAATPEGLFGCANWQTPHPHFVAIPFADGSAHPITHLCYSQNTLFASYDKGIASLRNDRLVPLAHIAPDYYTLVFALGNTLLCSTPTQLCALPMLPPCVGRAADWTFANGKKTLDWNANTKAITNIHDTLWVATSQGLARIDLHNGRDTLFNETNGLPNPYIYAALPDENGGLWLSTNKGLARFDTHTNTCRAYTPLDGLQGNEFNTFAFAKKPSGELLFGGSNGFNAFFARSIQDYTAQALPLLVHLQVNDAPYPTLLAPDQLKNLRLAFANNTLTFALTAIEYADAPNNKLRYQLVGYDNAPIISTIPATVRYANLPAGGYTLKVWAANADGIWNPTPYQLPIEILPPFWQTWWFRLGCLSAIIGIGYWAYKTRINQLQRTQQERLKVVIDTQEHERRRIASDMHDDLGPKLSAVKLYLSALATNTQKDTDIRDRSLSLVNETITEVRTILNNLSPKILEEHGYVRAAEALVAQLNAADTVVCEFYALKIAPNTRFAPEIEFTLYRITQELLHNGIKYANAQTLTLQLRQRPQKLILTYEDDGIGFDVATVGKGYGLQNITSRIHALNGKAVLESAVGEGTRWTVEVGIL